MKNLIITLGGKGGVGKTLALTILADFLTVQGREFVALDCDTENAGKASAFGSILPEAGRPNLRSVADCDRLLTTASDAECALTLADLPANASGDFLTWFEQVADEETLAALNVRIIGLGVITPEPATFASVAEWAAKLQRRATYVVVKNQRMAQRVERTSAEMFPEYHASDTGRKFRKVFSPQEVELPGLFEGSMAAFLRAGCLPSEIESKTSAIPILDRTRIRTWTKQVHAQWASVVEALKL